MKIVIFTGAGVSADSGISTFRDSNGLWANYRIEDVCTPEALRNNRAQVIEFYNIRRKELLERSPNEGHYSIVDLANYFNVEVITQNVDDLHERAANERGSSLKVLHLHGELRKLCSSINPEAIIPIEGWHQGLDERHSDGSLLRPHVVFFGESVPMMEQAIKIVADADVFIIVGTSLAVYPAASLVDYLPSRTKIYLVDPSNVTSSNRITHIKERSVTGLPKLVSQLKQTINND